MNFLSQHTLTDKQVTTSLNYIIKEGAATEVMSTFTGGTFLVAVAVMLKATNFQIGLLAALPTLTNIFQLLAVWLVQKYRNRRLICVVCNFIARVPLLVIGFVPLLFSSSTALEALFFLLFVSYLFGSIAGASWNSWMKDLVPEGSLGIYYSKRGRILQSLNVVLSLLIAVSLDYVKRTHPEKELLAYVAMFIVGGAAGLVGVYLLSRAAEPTVSLQEKSVLSLLKKPLKDKNFRNLLTFNCSYVFATNMALPFFVVYMMKTIGLPLTYIIVLGLLAKASSILSIKFWGRYSDQYSNKTTILVCAPTFVLCIFAWTFTSPGSSLPVTIALLGMVHILSGVSAAGIDLSINNIAIKLAPASDAIAYMSARNIILAVFSSLAPICGGLLADLVADHQLVWSVSLMGSGSPETFHLFGLNHSNLYFVVGAILAALSLNLLKSVEEPGEVDKKVARIVLKKQLGNSIRKMTYQRFTTK